MGIPTHLTLNKKLNPLSATQLFLVTPQNLDNYFWHVLKYRNFFKSLQFKRTPYTFWKPNTGVVKPTHVWGLPPQWLIPHICDFFHTGVDFRTLVVKPKPVWVLPHLFGVYTQLQNLSHLILFIPHLRGCSYIKRYN